MQQSRREVIESFSALCCCWSAHLPCWVKQQLRLKLLFFLAVSSFNFTDFGAKHVHLAPGPRAWASAGYPHHQIHPCGIPASLWSPFPGCLVCGYQACLPSSCSCVRQLLLINKMDRLKRNPPTGSASLGNSEWYMSLKKQLFALYVMKLGSWKPRWPLAFFHLLRTVPALAM